MKKSVLMIVAVLAAGLAFAGEGKKDKGGGDKPHRPPPSFEQMDADKDGKVTAEEFKAAAPPKAPAEKIEAKFKKLDANADGSISKDEMPAKKEGHGDKGKHGEK